MKVHTSLQPIIYACHWVGFLSIPCQTTFALAPLASQSFRQQLNDVSSRNLFKKRTSALKMTRKVSSPLDLNVVTALSGGILYTMSSEHIFTADVYHVACEFYQHGQKNEPSTARVLHQFPTAFQIATPPLRNWKHCLCSDIQIGLAKFAKPAASTHQCHTIHQICFITRLSVSVLTTDVDVMESG
jgi:hypothetical protein